jgi:signal peptidase I
VDNVEFLLTAAIVILGIKVYFVQPFKIPTNSMWPSYYGMTPQVYQGAEEVPGPLAKAARFVAFGAFHHRIVAPESGIISVPVDANGTVKYDTVRGRRWLVLPATKRQYVLKVNETPVRFQLPLDFNDFDQAFHEAMGTNRTKLAEAHQRSRQQAGPGLRWVQLEKRAQAGEPIMTFDILTGDQLFVDRVSYHFVRPKVGQGFVFRTGAIPGIARVYGDQYYIKRLVGTPGDVLEVREPELWRNGVPITGSEAFAQNARREKLYGGYGYAPEDQAMLLRPGQTATVPADSYLALGDNSGNSSDGRYWGYVPAKSVVGKPLFIYFPFTSRWMRSP